jgi:hypothetical protein
MPVRLFGIPPRLGRAGRPLWFCRGSGASLLAHVREAPEEPSYHAPSALNTVRQSLKRGSRAQEVEVTPLQERENPPVTSSQA